ncbi:MAG: DUF4831 family protein [Bacteroidales bacterium]|jgi:hypothetical protein|nr:DUF4831 family protein [Bacteroidales bacterium]
MTTYKISTIAALITFVFLNSCTTSKKATVPETVILPLSDTVRPVDGSVVYALPRTVISIRAEVEHTIEIPGPYSQYAGEMLGLDKVIRSENEIWSLGRIFVRSHEEIDPSEYYMLKSNSIFHSNVLVMKKEGLILDLNPANLRPFVADAANPGRQLRGFEVFDMGSDEYFQSQSDTAYRRVAIDSSFVRIPYIVEKKKKLSIEQMAERAAKRLMELREGKHLILTGEANVFPQSEAAIAEINRIEKEYTELFTGKTFTETVSFDFQLIPEKDMAGKELVVFRFSETTGPLSQNQGGGYPVTAKFTPELKTKDLTFVAGASAPVSNQQFDRLYYRMPDVARITVSAGDRVLYNGRILVFQFGELLQLPANYIIGK